MDRDPLARLPGWRPPLFVTRELGQQQPDFRGYLLALKAYRRPAAGR